MFLWISFHEFFSNCFLGHFFTEKPYTNADFYIKNKEILIIFVKSMILSLPFPLIDPVAVSIGSFKIYWYGLAYVIGTMIAWSYGKLLIRKYPNGLVQENIDDAVVWMLLSAVIGGRLGYVCFYDPAIIFHNPLEVFMTWRGGMSFHGGLVGVIVGSLILCRRKKISYFRLMDVAGTSIPIILFLGRVANFINAEMYGRITDVSWGVVYPNGGPLPRHPSQLYEAFFEGIVLFLLLSLCWTRTKLRDKPGRMSGLFLIGYGIFRIIIESFKEPEAWIGTLTIGQLLSLPLVGFGWYLLRRPVKTSSPDA